jgi:type IV secretory pathway VirJ component
MSPTQSPLRRRPVSIGGLFGAPPRPSSAAFLAILLVLGSFALAPVEDVSLGARLAAQVHEVRGNALPSSLRDLPLVVLPAPVGPGRPMALVMSGDGNWAHFISELSDTLAERGIPVAGLKSRSWLSHPRTPEELATDMQRVLRYYLKAWSVHDFIIVGYSRGADFAPFLVNRLGPDLRSNLRGVALFSPTLAANFTFHIEDLVRFVARKDDRPTVPQIDEIHGLPLLCVYGKEDKETLCPSLTPSQAELVPRDSGHRLHDAGVLADLLIARMGGGVTRP